ncbi:uncharacterized protein LOC122055425 isoform X2 [Zingiber officinale]|uniref:Uncharacterized protein n=1 Tax=Zingiber officinale TaxID=94328 RepID=A0A8J5HI66_ZINOF|nr:uncharacterized protein LOC122055425 isoform X2 [Zingiber officinale]KAG6516981.1 hypothetical protein ZIOFF_020357 [Zingiber officinale]
MTSLLVSPSPPLASRASVHGISVRRCRFALRFLQHRVDCSPRRERSRSYFCADLRQDFTFSGGFLKDLSLVSKGRKGPSVRANQGFGFNGVGGGGGGWDRSSTTRVLGNLTLAIGLTYLTMTGQLGWILDTIVSIWLLAVLLPIIGLGAFFWFAGRDIIQSSCPNCGNEFQILRSATNDDPQLCPFCSQPFSVQGDIFVREPSRFSSNRPISYRRSFNGFSARKETGKASSAAVVDIEADVKDID